MTTESTTLPQLFINAYSSNPADKVAVRYAVRRADADPHARLFTEKFQQVAYTWREYANHAEAFARGLIARDVRPGTCVTIQGANAPHWLFAHIGTMLAGGISAGVYPNNSPEASQHVATDSSAEVVVVENVQQLEKYRGMENSAVKAFVVWNSLVRDVEGLPAPAYSWEEFCREGESVTHNALQGRIEQIDPKDTATLIYTSGTTGMPKGVELSHENLTWPALSAGHLFEMTESDLGLSYLPLSHIAAQQLDCVVPMAFGSAINIAAADALKGANLRDHVINTRPTYFLAIPRVWEKFKDGIENKLKEAPAHRQWLFHQAASVGRRVAADKRGDNDNLTGLKRMAMKVRQLVDAMLFKLYDNLVFSKLHTALGLDRCRVFASGAAPIAQEVLDFFDGINVRIVDVYGMSESSGPATISLDPRLPPHSCGKALPGTELIIADDGEVRVKGPHVCKGYWNNPQKTAELFDENGYLKSGDLGRLDENGFLFITGRKKELIVTAGGENIPPVKIEQKVKANIPMVSQAVVIGDGRPFLTCLLTLKTAVDADGQPTEQLAPEVKAELEGLGIEGETLADVCNSEALRAHLNAKMQEVNATADSRAQRIGKITVLPEDFSLANGCLTPTLKLKRPAITARYTEHIERMYAN